MERKMATENCKKNFKDTLNLPHTDFPIRANYAQEDAAMLQRWETENLYQKTFEHHKGQEKFILHDGPPYANGHLHMGHAYNKILKDIVCKSQRMLGKHVPVTPGWDCHGLPIEFAVKKEQPELAGAALKKACRAYAQKWIDTQREEFKNLGVLMNWDRPFLTMSFEYEAAIVRAFGEFVEQGYIERKNKTVPWCPSCKTVLASAEIEYADRKDPSIYVLFTLTKETQAQLFPFIDNNNAVSLLVWTTTPWTLPLNRAVLLKPDTSYVLLECNDHSIIVGKVLADKISTMLSIEKKIIAEFTSDQLISIRGRAHHPLIDNYEVPILTDDSVLTEDGTACVHSAPGAGPIDYEVGIKHNLEIYSPVNAAGIYTADIQPHDLVGVSITDGQGWVIKELLEKGKLLLKTSIKHSYPHCWRCRGGLIFRATKQWFCDLSQNSLKDRALDAIDALVMNPESSRNRFSATLEGRLEWCLSRQREWGVPIPAMICNHCDYAMTNKEFINTIATLIETDGIEKWDTITRDELSNIAAWKCTQCGSADFRKETDILDVWFESGVSHYAVLYNNHDLAYPADMYLEGKDQHRAWFQSSLLTSMVLEKKACMKSIYTHGFTVDQKGKKMSKSLGNVVAPQHIIDMLGTDGLRLWAASIDNTGDAVISDIVLKNIQEVLRKIRNTCRFLLSNTNDFDNNDAISLQDLKLIDKYALKELDELNGAVIEAYKEYNFTKVFHLLGTYCSVNLSAFYLDIIKDRLYVEKSNGFERRSAQTVCAILLDTLTKLMAPILSFTAEHISDHYQKNRARSIHLSVFPPLNTMCTNPASVVHWHTLKEMRSALLKAIEIQREKGVIKHSLEAQVTVYSTQAIDADFFKEFLIVSQVNCVQSAHELEETIMSGLYARVEHAEGVKCPRCWHWSVTDNPDDLCKRCFEIVR